MNLIVSMLVVVTLLFGGGAAVSAAQDDLPNDPLYRVKLAREDASVWLASDPTLKIARLMGQAQARAEEMATLAAQGITPPAETSLRMHQEIQHALRWAAMLDEAKMMAALQQVRTRLQTQEQLMSQIQDGSCAQCEPILRQTREMLQTQLGQVEDALADPDTFQIQERNQVRTTLTPAPTRSVNTPQASCTPVLDGTGQRNGADDPLASTPEPPDDKGNGNGPSSGPGGGQGGRP